MSKIIGIDLGTSTSEVAIMENGKPVIIPNHIGEMITPSAIHIAKDGQITVGIEASEKTLLEPQSTFIEVKRMMGSDQKLHAHGNEYTPTELSSYILRYMADCAKAYLKETIDRVVITVPAYFSDIQRKATMEAGHLAGLTVERIINEPTAAALCYGIDHLNDCSNVLVYDFGGGTLDVTVLEMFEGVLEVRASSGNNKLGGKDFDETIMDYILDTFSAEQKSVIKKELHAMSRLKKESERCKIALSTASSYHVALPFLADVKGKPVSVDLTITQKQFEEMITTAVVSTKAQIDLALKDAELNYKEIDAILLVGGTTKIPFIEVFLTEIFDKSPLHLIDPDLSVAAGAAIQADILGGENDSGLIMTDVCPYTLGTSALIGDLEENSLIFDPIIQRNTTIPVTKDKLYCTAADGQTTVEINVYQGEYLEPARNNFLGNFMLSGIPPARAGSERIKIAFSYDVNGILQVDATIVSTNKAASISISTNEDNMEEEIDISKWRDSKRSKKYSAIVRRAERMLSATGDTELLDLLRMLKEGLVKDEDSELLDEYREALVDYMLLQTEDDE